MIPEHLELPRYAASASSSRHVLAVQTSVRPSRIPSLWKTLRSLEAAGAGGWTGPRLIVSDGWAPIVSGWQMFSSCRQLGSAATFVSLLRASLSECPDLEAITYCQDDVVLVRSALDYVLRIQVPEQARLTTWFSERVVTAEDRQPFLGMCQLSTFYNAQFVTMRADLVREIVDRAGPIDCGTHGCDLMAARLPGARESYCAVHVPSLAQHARGLDSACGHSHLGARLSPDFPGEDWNALRWIAGSSASE